MKTLGLFKSAAYWLLWIIIRLFTAIFIPYKTLLKRNFIVRTILWLIFSICFSLIGTIINIIKFAVFNIPATSFAGKCFWERV